MAGLFGRARSFLQRANEPGGWTERLGMLGASLQDINDGGQRAVAMRQAQMQQQAAQQRQAAMDRLNGGLFGGRQQPQTLDLEALSQGNLGPTETERAQTQGPTGLPSLRDMAPELIRAQQSGIDIGPYVSLLDKTGPDVAYEQGHRYDRRDPNSAPRFAASIPEGQEPVYDARGNVIGVRNMDGSIQAAAERERAVYDARNASQASYAGAIAEQTSAGQGRGSSPYAIETVQGPDGRPITASRAQLLGQGPIYGQSAADQARDVGAANRDVELTGNYAQAAGRIASADQSAAALTDLISTARGQINGLSTGLVGAASGGVPGSPARDLRATIDTIKANVGFDYLQQMRELSPTGGALGQVAVQEMMALQSVLGNLDPNQSPEQLDRNLQRIEQLVSQGQRLRREAFEQQYGGQQQRQQPAAPSRAELEAEARRRGLIR